MGTTTDLSRKVAEAVVEALASADISVLAAAERTGIARMTLDRCLKGTRAFDIVELELVAQMLGRSAADFLLVEGAAA
jgi:hypothetical protein